MSTLIDTLWVTSICLGCFIPVFFVLSAESELIPKAGEKYEYSLDFDKENPFEPKVIDTVTVCDVKEGYILFENKNGKKRSCKVQFFLKYTKELK